MLARRRLVRTLGARTGASLGVSIAESVAPSAGEHAVLLVAEGDEVVAQHAEPATGLDVVAEGDTLHVVNDGDLLAFHRLPSRRTPASDSSRYADS